MRQLSFAFLIACALHLVLSNPAFTQWQKVCGAYGGPTHTILVTSHDNPGSGELYAGTDHGPFRSVDNGANWTPANAGLQDSITALASNAFGVFASTLTGVYFSSNHGLSWSLTDSTSALGGIHCLEGAAAYLFVGSDSGLFVTTDNGESWRKSDTMRATVLLMKVAPSSDTTIFALATSVMRSSDHGLTWTKALPGGTVFVPPRSYFDRPLFCLASHDSFAVAGSFGKVFRSTDDGKNWSASSPLPEVAPGYPLNLNVTAVGVDDSSLYASTGPNLFRSTDGGTSWFSVSNGLPKGNDLADQLIYSLTGDGHMLYAATLGGVFASTNQGVSWVARTGGLDASAPYSLAASGSFVYAALGSGYFLAKSSDSGLNWIVLNDTAYFRVRSLAANGSSVIGGTNAPRNYDYTYCPAPRSSDNGVNWSIDTTAPIAWMPHEYAMNDNYLFVGTIWGGAGIARCHRDSSVWTWLPWPPRNSIEGIAVDGSNVIAADDSYRLWYSSDNGESWSIIFNELGYTHEPLNTIAAEGAAIYAGTLLTWTFDYGRTRHGLWRTTDSGSTWTDISHGLPDNNITSIVIAGSKVLAATDSSGIFISGDKGAHWYPLNEGLPNPYIASLVSNGEYLYVGAVGGIYRLPLSEAVVSVQPEPKGIPLQCALEQNYPNPFNPTTTIKYTIEGTRGSGLGARNTRLVVYDLLGREVAILVDEVKQPGTYTVEFDASGLASGVYFCRMTAGSFVQTRELCLVR